MTVKGAFALVVVATHSKVLPCSCGTTVGQTTLAWRWRSLRMLSSMESATRAVSSLVAAVELVEEEDEPQALIRAAQASAVKRDDGPATNSDDAGGAWRGGFVHAARS